MYKRNLLEILRYIISGSWLVALVDIAVTDFTQKHPMSYDASRNAPAYKHMQGVYRDIFGKENLDHFSFFLKEKPGIESERAGRKSC